MLSLEATTTNGGSKKKQKHGEMEDSYSHTHRLIHY